MREMSQYQDMPVGSYRLTKLIGVGPVSRVFLAARQDRAERLVALKLFEAVPLDLLEEKDQALDEVRLLACLEHPSILPMLDDGLYEHMLYLVAPHIEAGSLRQRLNVASAAGELLPLKETMALLRQVGDALQFAHTQRMVHANLKPENILLPGDGKALLADFLLPSLVKSERAARILSTFAAFYMAPEQFQGAATPLSDQYALACLAYELLTGQPPFDGDNVMSLARKHATGVPKPPSQLQPRRAQHIDHVLLKALAKRPEERYPDVQTFLAELSAPPPLVSPIPASEPAPNAQVFPTMPAALAAEIKDASPLQLAFPLSFAGFEDGEASPLPQSAQPAANAALGQGPEQHVHRQALPISIAVFEHETVAQTPVEAPLVARVPDLHDVPTVAVPAMTVSASPLASMGQQLPASAQGHAQDALRQAYAPRAQSTSRLSRRQIWLAASLVALAMVVSISGIAIFFSSLSANHTPSGAGSTATVASTTSAGQTPTGATSTSTVIAAVSSPTVATTPSPTATPVTPTPGVSPTARAVGLTCQVNYKVSSSWSNGFVANLTITNTGGSTIQGWTLVFTFSGNEQVTNGWNGKFTQNGAQVKIADAGFNASLAPGTSASPGFQASTSGGNAVPASFSLNGVLCK